MASEDDDLPLIQVDPRRMDICMDAKCAHKLSRFGPHKHYLRQCQQHPFCEMEKGTIEISAEDGMPMPRECDYEVPEYLSKEDPAYVGFVARLAKRREKNQLAKGQRLVATKYSLAHWEAQSQGLDVDKLPANGPKRVPKAYYEALRRRAKDSKSGNGADGGRVPEGDEEADYDEDAGSGAPSETAGHSQARLTQDLEDFTIKKMDQLRPHIHAKAAWVETLTEKVLRRRAEGQKKSVQAGQQAQTAQLSEPTASKSRKGAGPSARTEAQEGAQARAEDSPCTACSAHAAPHPRKPGGKEALQLYRSPYIYGFLQRSEVDCCVERMRKNRTQESLLEVEDAEQESEAEDYQDAAPIKGAVQQERRGQASFITIRKNTKRTATDKKNVRQNSSATTLASNQRSMSTFQKLQMLKKKNRISSEELGVLEPERAAQPSRHRKIEPPIHRLVRKAAVEMPKSHLEDIKKLRMQEYLLANSNAVDGPLGPLYTQTEAQRVLERRRLSQPASRTKLSANSVASSAPRGLYPRNEPRLPEEDSIYLRLHSQPHQASESPLTGSPTCLAGGTQKLVGSVATAFERRTPSTASNAALAKGSGLSALSRAEGDRHKLDQFLQQINQRQARLNLHIAKANIVGFSQLGASRNCVVSPDVSQRKEVLVQQLQKYKPRVSSGTTRARSALGRGTNAVTRAATNAASGRETDQAKPGIEGLSRSSAVPLSDGRSSQYPQPGQRVADFGDQKAVKSVQIVPRGPGQRMDSKRTRKLRAVTASAVTRAKKQRRPTIQMPLEVANSATSHHVVSDQRKLKSILQRIHLGPELSESPTLQKGGLGVGDGGLSAGQNPGAFKAPLLATQYLAESSAPLLNSSKESHSGQSGSVRETRPEPPIIRGPTRTFKQKGKSLFVNIQDQTQPDPDHSQDLDFGNQSGVLNPVQDATPALIKSDRGSSKRRASLGSGQKIGVPSHGGASHSHHYPRKPFITPYEIEHELEEVPLAELDRANLQVNVILDLQFPDSSKEPENMFECAEYWLSKGLQAQTGLSPLQVIQASHQKASERRNLDRARGQQQPDAGDQALDFYFQGLRKDPFHFGCCFNAGITYLHKCMNLNAQKWFSFARQLEPDRKEPYLGEAISSLKLGQISRCLQSVRQRPGQSEKNQRHRRASVDLDQIVSDGSNTNRKTVSTDGKQEDGRAHHTDGQSSGSEPETQIQKVKLDIECQFQFLEAITYKKAYKFDKSQKEYKKLESIFQARLGERMARYIFTNLMLPMQVDRKVVEDYVQIFLDEVSITDRDAYWDESLHEPLTKIIHFKTHKWENIDKAVLYLADKPLFKRLRQSGYTRERFKQLVPELAVVIKDAGDIVQSEDGYLFIVLNGRVVLRYHDKDPLEFQYMAQYTAGKVIGHKTLDHGYSLMGQVFPLVVSHKCVLLRVRTKVFEEEIWARTKNKSTEVKINYLRNFPLVQELSDQTLYDIMYESKKILRFRPGDTVLRCHPRSPLSFEGRALYDKEYGSHMKEDVNRAMLSMNEQTIKKRADGKSKGAAFMPKTSAFGSFFAMVNQKKKEREKNEESEEAYYRSFTRPKLYEPGRPPESNCRSVALILDGSCRVVHRHKALASDGVLDEAQLKDPDYLNKNIKEVEFELCELRSGDHFGASDLLRIQDIEFLGDLVAGENGLKVLIIERPDQAIQLCERKALQEKLKGKYDFLKIMLENKYTLGNGAFTKY